MGKAIVRSTYSGVIEKTSRGSLRMLINGRWFNWGDRTGCRMVKRIDNSWTYYGKPIRFYQLRAGMQVKVSYLRIEDGNYSCNQILSLGIVESSGIKEVAA